MSQVTFFAAPEDFAPLLGGLLADPDACLFEVYSSIGESVRVFTTASDAVHALALGHDPDGTGAAGFLGLWVPRVMPRPTIRRIDLDSRKFPPGTWRETTEGCGLFWLQAGGVHGDGIIASSTRAFTERGARLRCAVRPGPDEVDWPAHRVVHRRLARLVRRELAVARAGPYPVLAEALQRHRAGANLRIRARGKEFTVAP